MTEHAGALEIPPVAAADPEAREIGRVWVSDGSQQVSLRVGIWEDPFAWGIFLVDLAKHVANAYHQTDGLDLDETLARIRGGFEAEWDSPTDQPTGRVTE